MTETATFLEINQLQKSYGVKPVLQDINLTLGAGEIVGLIGPNGAGKSTLLKCIMGLITYQGEIQVFGQAPMQNRAELLKKMSYVADVAALPNWMKVVDLFDHVNNIHPLFVRQRAEQLIADSGIELTARIVQLSKGMKTRLHLAIILAIDTNFLILDEPTLGLDVLVRRNFQDRLISDYYNQQRSILITTHQIDEIEDILTRVLFIKDGKITLDIKLNDLKTSYAKLTLPQALEVAELAAEPIYQRQLPDSYQYLFANIDASLLSKLSDLGDVSAPSLEDLFVATNLAEAE